MVSGTGNVQNNISLGGCRIEFKLSASRSFNDEVKKNRNVNFKNRKLL
jgi:hypothetical protein